MATKQVRHWQDALNLFLGLWMIASPWALGYQTNGNSSANAVIVGIIVALVALAALFQIMAWEEAINVGLGVWLVISPWILGFSGLVAAMSNAVIVGIAVVVLALWILGTDKDIGGWWNPAT